MMSSGPPGKPWRIVAAAAAAVAMVLQGQGAAAQTKTDQPAFIRDAEIEGLMRIYTKDIFRAAGIPPGVVDVYLINSPGINAFVAGGQRIFIHTGLLQQAKTPNEVIGVLAHETGHITGGHLARMNNQLDKASNLAIVSTLLGAAAMIGAGLAGSNSMSEGGQAMMMGGQSMAQRSMLAYARAQEASADQAAAQFLDKTGQSGKGMLELFQTLANQTIASTRFVSPYALTHPMPLERIRNLEVMVKKSPAYEKPDPPGLTLRHALMQAKLFGFLNGAQAVYLKYPSKDQSLPARYARAIVAFRIGDLRNAIPEIDRLISEVPKNPYFWELKGQALLEGGRPQEAIAPLREAVRLLPHNGLINLMLAQALVGTEKPDQARAALAVLKVVQRTEAELAPRAYVAGPGLCATRELCAGGAVDRRGRSAQGRQEAGRR